MILIKQPKSKYITIIYKFLLIYCLYSINCKLCTNIFKKYNQNKNEYKIQINK